MPVLVYTHVPVQAFTPITLRLRPDDYVFQHFFYFSFCKNASYIPPEMNTVNYYPTDNCGICTPFSPRVSSDVAFMWFNCADFDVFLSFPRSSCRSGDEYRHSQHRYGVRSQYGKWVIITPFSSLFLNMSRTNDKCNVCTCQGKYPPSPLGKPFALLLCGVLFVRLFVFLLFS